MSRAYFCNLLNLIIDIQVWALTIVLSIIIYLRLDLEKNAPTNLFYHHYQHTQMSVELTLCKYKTPNTLYFIVNVWMNGVLGHYSALVRLYWAGDNMGLWDFLIIPFVQDRPVDQQSSALPLYHGYQSCKPNTWLTIWSCYSVGCVLVVCTCVFLRLKSCCIIQHVDLDNMGSASWRSKAFTDLSFPTCQVDLRLIIDTSITAYNHATTNTIVFPMYNKLRIH